MRKLIHIFQLLLFIPVALVFLICFALMILIDQELALATIARMTVKLHTASTKKPPRDHGGGFF